MEFKITHPAVKEQLFDCWRRNPDQLMFARCDPVRFLGYASILTIANPDKCLLTIESKAQVKRLATEFETGVNEAQQLEQGRNDRARKNAWKADALSDRQRGLLTKLGVEFDESWTKGKASRTISKLLKKAQGK